MKLKKNGAEMKWKLETKNMFEYSPLLHRAPEHIFPFCTFF